MKTLAEQFDDQSKQLVWLDSWDYCENLFLQAEKVSWGDSAAFDGFVRKTDALLQPTVTSLPLMKFLEWVLVAMPNLKSAMAEKSRTGYALKTLLRNEDLRKAITQAINVAANAVPNKPLVIDSPSPRTLVVWAYETAHGKAPENLTVDHSDSASVYLSDFISSLSATDASGLLVNETDWNEEEWKEESTIYTPLKNVSDYQKWSLGLKTPFEVKDKETTSGFNFLISAGDLNSEDAACGKLVEENFWGASKSEEVKADFIFSEVSKTAVPEVVLENRKLLGGF